MIKPATHETSKASFYIQTRGKPQVLMLAPHLQFAPWYMVPLSFCCILGQLSGILQQFCKVKFAYRSSAVLIKGEEITEMLQFLGYQAKIDSSNTVDAMNVQI